MPQDEHETQFQWQHRHGTIRCLLCILQFPSKKARRHGSQTSHCSLEYASLFTAVPLAPVCAPFEKTHLELKTVTCPNICVSPGNEQMHTLDSHCSTSSTRTPNKIQHSAEVGLGGDASWAYIAAPAWRFGYLGELARVHF